METLDVATLLPFTNACLVLLADTLLNSVLVTKLPQLTSLNASQLLIRRATCRFDPAR